MGIKKLMSNCCVTSLVLARTGIGIINFVPAPSAKTAVYGWM